MKKKQRRQSLELIQTNGQTELNLFDYRDVQDGEARVLPLYDSLPRFVVRKRRESESAKIVSQKTKINGVEISVKISPATIERRPASQEVSEESALPQTLESKHIYPGVREEIVEHALRYLAVQNLAGMSVGDTKTRTNVARVTFSLKQLADHLAETNHTLDLNEIKEALMVLAGAMLVIESSDNDRIQGIKAPMIGNLFFEFGIDDELGERSRCSCELHPLAVQAILTNGFFTIHHRILMSLRRYLSRWIYSRMTIRFRQAEKMSFDKPQMGYSIRLSTILAESGIARAARMRDNITRVRESLEELRDEHLLAFGDTPFSEERIYAKHDGAGRPKVSDVSWTLFPSNGFAETVINDNVKAKKRRNGATEAPVFALK